MHGLLFISLNLSLVACKTAHRNLSAKDIESLETSRHVVGAGWNGNQVWREMETHDGYRPKQADGPWHTEAQEERALSRDL